MAVGVLAGFISIQRIRLGNPDALSTLVWAEDGLYPLCAKAHGMLTCLADPYAGYLSLVPRLVAWPVSWFPLDAWPLVTNVAAAISAGIVAALVSALLRSGSTGVVASVIVALLPVLAPIMRIESINTTASIYWLIGFLAALAVCFPPSGRFPTVAYVVGGAVTVLTLPAAGVLLLPLAVQALRRRIPRRAALIVFVAVAIGSLIQAIAVVTADGRRDVVWSLGSLKRWADILPSALRIQLPGFTDATVDDGFSALSSWGWVLALCLVVLALALIFARRAVHNSVGLLLLAGVLLGVSPVLIGSPNNRYFVLPVLLVLAAAVLALDAWLPRFREAIMAVVAVLLVVAWWPGLPASPFRAVAAPLWPTMLSEVRAGCLAAPADVAIVLFSPVWPDPQMRLFDPSTNVVPCVVLTSSP